MLTIIFNYDKEIIQLCRQVKLSAVYKGTLYSPHNFLSEVF